MPNEPEICIYSSALCHFHGLATGDCVSEIIDIVIINFNMQFAKLIQTSTNSHFDDDKHLITNLNTNHSLAFSQSLGDRDNRLEQKPNDTPQTRATIYSSHAVYRLPSTEKQLYQSPSHDINAVISNSIAQRDVDRLLTSLKMISFYTKQTTDRKAFIDNKAKGLKNLRNKIQDLEDRIKSQKDRFQRKWVAFQKRVDSMKKNKREMNRRIVTEMVEMKIGINSIKKKLSSQHNSSAKTGTKEVSKRRNSMRISTEEVLYIPLPQASCTNKSSKRRQTQQYQEMYPQRCLWPKPNPEVPLSPYRKISMPSNQKLAQIMESHSSRTSRAESRTKPVEEKRSSSKNLFEIFTQKLEVHQSSNKKDLLTVPRPPVLITDSQQVGNRTGNEANQSKAPSHKLSNFDESSVKILLSPSCSIATSSKHDPHTHKKQLKQEKVQIPEAESIFFPFNHPRNFNIADLSDSVQSEYTVTEQSFQPSVQKNKGHPLRRFQDSSTSHKKGDNEDINEQVLTSKSKFSRDSKYFESKLSSSRNQYSYNMAGESGLGDLRLVAQSSQFPIRL